MKKVLLFLKKIRISEQFELQAFKAAIAFTLLLVAVLSLGAWWSHRIHRLSSAEVVEPIPTMVVPDAPTHYPAIQPDSGVKEWGDSLPTAIPTVTATATETLQRADVTSEYPELVARVDAAVKSAYFEPLPEVQVNDCYKFRWNTHFDAPDLIGIKGGEIYNPYTKPYRFTHTFKLRALDENVERKLIVKAININGLVEIPISELPPGKYEWTVSGWLHTRPYDNMTDWLAWQPFVVTNP